MTVESAKPTKLVRSPARENISERERPLRLKIHGWIRWVHTYLSMFSLMLILFFSATGLTLNHQDWVFGQKTRQTDIEGKIPVEWLAAGETDENKVARLEIVEHLRKTDGVRGAVEEFRVDEMECMVSLKAPGYSADTFIDRKTGTYRLTTMEEGVVAAMNDLHKGRHSGKAWLWVIDFSAGFLILISLTGLGLIFYLKRIQQKALLTVVAGLVLMILLMRFFVP